MQPRLDHLMQYSVDRISTQDKQPAIVFENGYKIIAPGNKADLGDLKGARLQNVEDKGISDQLIFATGTGTEEVQYRIDLNKGEYMIYDPETGETVDPNEPVDPNAGLPLEPVERIAEGPTSAGEETVRGEREEEAEIQ